MDAVASGKIWAEAGHGASLDAPSLLLPAEIALAVTHDGGGRVVLVVGAGVSIEAPTSLPSGTACAAEAHRRLVADNIIVMGQCHDPNDLSVVADAVFEARDGTQAELVQRLPREQFILAKPNEGHLLAAALLREGAVASVLTLNFDLAFTSALMSVGAGTDVAIIRGPEDQSTMSTRNLVYLHRTANHDPEEWILRTSALTEAWTASWEQAIANRILVAPVVVFAGLGSPAAVLTATAKHLLALLNPGVRAFQVDVIEREDSTFAANVGLDNSNYLKMGWVAFMRLLAARLVVEHVERIAKACKTMAESNGWVGEDVARLCDSIKDRGLLALGGMRANWMLEEAPYLPADQCDADHFADLLLSVRLVERESNTAARFDSAGLVEFWEQDRLRATVAFISARGKWSWSALEPRVGRARDAWNHRAGEVRKVVVTGALGQPLSSISPPRSIAGETGSDDIVRGRASLEFVDVHVLRTAPTFAVKDLLGV